MHLALRPWRMSWDEYLPTTLTTTSYWLDQTMAMTQSAGYYAEHCPESDHNNNITTSLPVKEEPVEEFGSLAVDDSSPTPYSDAVNAVKNKAKRAVPTRIKRPLNAFMVWSQIERRKMSQLEPDLKHMEISRILGRRWQSLTPEERSPYVEEASRLKHFHLKEYPGYKFQPRKKAKGTKTEQSGRKTKSRTKKSDEEESLGTSSANVIEGTIEESSREEHEWNGPKGPLCCVVSSGICGTLQLCQPSISSGFSQHEMDLRRLNVRMTIDADFKSRVHSIRQLVVDTDKKRFQPSTICYFPDSPPLEQHKESYPTSSSLQRPQAQSVFPCSPLDSFTSAIIKSDPGLLTMPWNTPKLENPADRSSTSTEPVVLPAAGSCLTDLGHIITDLLGQLDEGK